MADSSSDILLFLLAPIIRRTMYSIMVQELVQKKITIMNSEEDKHV